jgi:hypothetical protein
MDAPREVSEAAISGNGLSFPSFESNPRVAGVEKVQVEAPAPNADEIRTTVHFTAVASEAEARALATKVNTAALDRIGFHHNIAIERARITGDQFSCCWASSATARADTGFATVGRDR